MERSEKPNPRPVSPLLAEIGARTIVLGTRKTPFWTVMRRNERHDDDISIIIELGRVYRLHETMERLKRDRTGMETEKRREGRAGVARFRARVCVHVQVVAHGK